MSAKGTGAMSERMDSGRPARTCPNASASITTSAKPTRVCIRARPRMKCCSNSKLCDWLAVRPKSADRHLFLNAMGTGMTRRGFAKRLVRHTQTAARSAPSITRKTVSPHLLRHACAIHTLEATGDIRKVSLWLGRSSVQSTEMYLQADPTDKLDTLEKWRPPSLRKGRFKGVQDELLAMLEGT